MLFQRRYRKLRRHHLTTLQRLAITLAACTLAVCCGLYAATELSHLAKHRINASVAKISKKLGVPIEIGRVELNLNTAHFYDLRIGAESQIVISGMQAELNINPFSAAFGELDNINVAHVRIKALEAKVRGSLAQAGDSSLATGPVAQTQRLIDRLFSALPSRHLSLGSVGITLLGEDGLPDLVVQGLKLYADKPGKQILLRAAEVKTRDGASDRDLQARFELSPNSTDYRFFVRRKASVEGKRNAWSIAGIVQKDLSGAQLSVELHSTPAFLAPLLHELPLEIGDLSGRSLIELARSGSSWQFSAQLQSLGSMARLPIVSSQEIGPLYFDLRVNGSWQQDTRALVLDGGTLTLPNRTTREYGDAPARFALAGSLRRDTAAAEGFIAAVHVTLPTTPCQVVLDAAPNGLFPALVDFRLEGEVAASLDVSLATADLEAANFSLHDSSFGCRVLEAPYAYSAERLNGPFSVLRQESKDEEPTYIDINPQAPSYAPLASISKNVNTAFITSEDAAFFSHKGIDTAALGSAIRRDLAERRVVVGGSTITMQTVKNLFLSQDRTLSRKLQELFLAWHLEHTLTKDRILEIYMNIVELGPGIYGVARAAEHFFGKHPFDLNLLEAAYLATLLPSPKIRYQYFCQGHMTPNFHELVTGLLKRMASLNRISTERFVAAAASSLHFNDEARLSSRDCSKKPSESEPVSEPGEEKDAPD